MKAIYFFLLMAFCTIYLVVLFKKLRKSKFTPEDFEFFRCRLIIKNKESFPKKVIQKAQQKYDEYLDKKNSSENKKRSLTGAPFIKKNLTTLIVRLTINK